MTFGDVFRDVKIVVELLAIAVYSFFYTFATTFGKIMLVTAFCFFLFGGISVLFFKLILAMNNLMH